MVVGRKPPRIAAKPSPTDWGPDDLLTLAEAAALFWPDGPLSEKSLRTVVRDSGLRHLRLAGKLFTTRSAIEAMCRGEGPDA